MAIQEFTHEMFKFINFMEKKISAKNKDTSIKTDEVLFDEIRSLIEQTRSRLAQTVNSALVLMNWHFGKRISDEVLKNKRAEYGKEIVASLSQQLTEEYGKGFTKQNLFHMMRFAEAFPDFEIVSALSRQLSWTHFRQIVYIEDELKRSFYAEMCRIERWNTRILDEKIQGMLFERTAISRKPEENIKNEIDELRDGDKLTPDLVFRDTYLLDFLGLSDTFSEKIWKTPFFASLKSFCSNLESVLRLSPGRNELRLTAMTFILICCSIIGN